MKIEYTYDWFRDNSDEIELWFDPEIVDWHRVSGYLAVYCSEYFEIWWDKDKYNWGYSWALAVHCSEYFEIWWDKDKYDWQNLYAFDLIRHCCDYKDIWLHDKRGRDMFFRHFKDDHGYLLVVKV